MMVVDDVGGCSDEVRWCWAVGGAKKKLGFEYIRVILEI